MHVAQNHFQNQIQNYIKLPYAQVPDPKTSTIDKYFDQHGYIELNTIFQF